MSESQSDSEISDYSVDSEYNYIPGYIHPVLSTFFRLGTGITEERYSVKNYIFLHIWKGRTPPSHTCCYRNCCLNRNSSTRHLPWYLRVIRHVLEESDMFSLKLFEYSFYRTKNMDYVAFDSLLPGLVNICKFCRIFALVVFETYFDSFHEIHLYLLQRIYNYNNIWDRNKKQ